MPPAPTSPGSDAEPLPIRLDTPRANHGRQPSLSIQSKMRSSCPPPRLQHSSPPQLHYRP
jgi:hypothetical protein